MNRNSARVDSKSCVTLQASLFDDLAVHLCNDVIFENSCQKWTCKLTRVFASPTITAIFCGSVGVSGEWSKAITKRGRIRVGREVQGLSLMVEGLFIILKFLPV